MERSAGRRENFFFRFARSNTGKLTGIALIGFATVEGQRVAVDALNGKADDIKVSAPLGTAYLSTASAIFLARRTSEQTEATSSSKK